MVPELVRAPSPAMMCNYLLGGKDNRGVDRGACHAIAEEFPDYPDAARASRQFMYRAVRYLSRYARVGQFLDLGCGLPFAPDVHEVARRFHRNARTIYVDNDPVVLAHARALLATAAHTAAVDADITTPEVFTDPEVRQVLDVSQPVAVLVLSVGHMIGDEAAHRMLATITEVMAPGSYLALAHLAAASQPAARQADHVAGELGLDWRFRTPAQLRRLLGALPLRLARPGLVDVTGWRPDPKQAPLPSVHDMQACPSVPNRRRRLIAFGGVLQRIDPTPTPRGGFKPTDFVAFDLVPA
jgi:SAM-dependent methyltransferase